jgi:TonB family protein
MNAARKAWFDVVLAGALLAGVTVAAPPESPGAAYRRGDYAQTVKLLKPQAQAGRMDAQIMLGQMYLKGEGVAADPVQAVAWTRRAAEEGSAIAAFDMGVFSSSGIGGPHDTRTAALWYRKAAHQLYPDAAFNLAVLYHRGDGVDQSDAMALDWIDAGMTYLPASAGQGLKPRFEALRGSILASMSPDQIGAARRLVSPDGPVTPVRMRNKEILQNRAVKEYPLGLRQLARGGNVVVLLLVHADGTVGDTLIETSSGYPQIDAVTRRLLADAEIEPLRIDGQATESWQIVGWAWRATEEPWYSFSRMNVMPR